MGLSFLSLLYLQVSYIEEMMKTRKEQFDSAVRNSLDQVSKDVEAIKNRYMYQRALLGEVAWQMIYRGSRRMEKYIRILS